MGNLFILELAISLILIFFLFSLIISGIQELITGLITRSRGKFLKDSIDKILIDRQNKNWSELFYDHPLIDKLKRKRDSLPSYISSDTFSKCLINIITDEGKIRTFDNTNPEDIKYAENLPGDDQLKNFIIGLETLNQSNFKTLIKSFLVDCDNLQKLQNNIKTWFDEYQKRVTGWYKRKARWITFYITIIVTIGFNIDTIHITKELSVNRELRQSLTLYAESIIEKGNEASLYPDFGEKQDSLTLNEVKFELRKVDSLINEVQKLSLPIGWQEYKSIEEFFKPKGESLFLHLIGWIISIFALSLGAPYWFKIMNMVVNIRNTGDLPTTDKTGKKE
jgi:hypothetical protein